MLEFCYHFVLQNTLLDFCLHWNNFLRLKVNYFFVHRRYIYSIIMVALFLSAEIILIVFSLCKDIYAFYSIEVMFCLILNGFLQITITDRKFHVLLK